MDDSRRFPGDVADLRGSAPERGVAARPGVPSLPSLPTTGDAPLRPDREARASLQAMLGAWLREPGVYLPPHWHAKQPVGCAVPSREGRSPGGTTARGAGTLGGERGISDGITLTTCPGRFAGMVCGRVSVPSMWLFLFV